MQEKILKNGLTKQLRCAMIGKELAAANKFYAGRLAAANYEVKGMCLAAAKLGQEYTIKTIETGDAELDGFLFSLGCYSGEPITVIARRWGGCTVSIKDGRYHIDRHLAEAILV